MKQNCSPSLPPLPFGRGGEVPVPLSQPGCQTSSMALPPHPPPTHRSFRHASPAAGGGEDHLTAPQNRGWKERCFEEGKCQSYTHKSLRLPIQLKRKQRNLKTWDSGKFLHISQLQSMQNRAKTGEEVQLLICQGSKRLKLH